MNKERSEVEFEVHIFEVVLEFLLDQLFDLIKNFGLLQILGKHFSVGLMNEYVIK